VLICSERKVLLADCWFVLIEKYCWLVADKPNEKAASYDVLLKIYKEASEPEEKSPVLGLCTII
jgi:hypothetical protein